MEIVAMDMKLRGMYIARQLSFKGVSFEVNEVPLSEEFKQAYNDSVALVSSHTIFSFEFVFQFFFSLKFNCSGLKRAINSKKHRCYLATIKC